MKKGLVFIGALAVALSAVMADRWEGEGETSAIAQEAPETPETPVSETERPTAVSRDRQELPLPEALASILNDESVLPDDASERITAFAAGRDAQQEPVTIVREDLDADGAANEWAAVLFEDILVPGTEETLRRAAYGIVLAYADGRYSVQSFEFPEESYGRAKLETVAELTGDERPDIVWASFLVGAHTSHAAFTVSSWADGKLRMVQGTADIPNVSRATAEDGKLALTGGLIGSAGAGPWQREYTDEYVVAEGALVRVDRTFAASPTPYHRLLDALWSEALGHTDRAKRSFAEAIEMEGASYEGYQFETETHDFVEGGSEPEREAAFEAAAKAFAGFRLELLKRVESGESREAACASAKEAAGYDAGWLPPLNSPFGYANPQWSEETICARIDALEP
ncbi:hypothetical protein [Paenibacillus sp.]|uniref:hypothetical protein n=1 Tax=Paenibacillus sp. TaxID=58172 RepID=UPI0028117C8C|nr:hypothetical protein [Paenibacillus sp.]